MRIRRLLLSFIGCLIASSLVFIWKPLDTTAVLPTVKPEPPGHAATSIPPSFAPPHVRGNGSTLTVSVSRSIPLQQNISAQRVVGQAQEETTATAFLTMPPPDSSLPFFNGGPGPDYTWRVLHHLDSLPFSSRSVGEEESAASFRSAAERADRKRRRKDDEKDEKEMVEGGGGEQEEEKEIEGGAGDPRDALLPYNSLFRVMTRLRNQYLSAHHVQTLYDFAQGGEDADEDEEGVELLDDRRREQRAPHLLADPPSTADPALKLPPPPVVVVCVEESSELLDDRDASSKASTRTNYDHEALGIVSRVKALVACLLVSCDFISDGGVAPNRHVVVNDSYHTATLRTHLGIESVPRGRSCGAVSDAEVVQQAVSLTGSNSSDVSSSFSSSSVTIHRFNSSGRQGAINGTSLPALSRSLYDRRTRYLESTFRSWVRGCADLLRCAAPSADPPSRLSTSRGEILFITLLLKDVPHLLDEKPCDAEYPETLVRTALLTLPPLFSSQMGKRMLDAIRRRPDHNSAEEENEDEQHNPQPPFLLELNVLVMSHFVRWDFMGATSGRRFVTYIRGRLTPDPFMALIERSAPGAEESINPLNLSSSNKTEKHQQGEPSVVSLSNKSAEGRNEDLAVAYKGVLHDCQQQQLKKKRRRSSNSSSSSFSFSFWCETLEWVAQMKPTLQVATVNLQPLWNELPSPVRSELEAFSRAAGKGLQDDDITQNLLDALHLSLALRLSLALPSVVNDLSSSVGYVMGAYRRTHGLHAGNWFSPSDPTAQDIGSSTFLLKGCSIRDAVNPPILVDCSACDRLPRWGQMDFSPFTGY